MDVDEKLIELVRAHYCLHDFSDNKYKSNIHKEMPWENIEQSLNMDRDTTRKRWKILRDGYRRMKKKAFVASGIAATLPRKMWRYSGAMSFPDGVQSYRNTIGNTTQLVPLPLMSPSPLGLTQSSPVMSPSPPILPPPEPVLSLPPRPGAIACNSLASRTIPITIAIIPITIALGGILINPSSSGWNCS